MVSLGDIAIAFPSRIWSAPVNPQVYGLGIETKDGRRHAIAIKHEPSDAEMWWIARALDRWAETGSVWGSDDDADMVTGKLRP